MALPSTLEAYDALLKKKNRSNSQRCRRELLIADGFLTQIWPSRCCDHSALVELGSQKLQMLFERKSEWERQHDACGS